MTKTIDTEKTEINIDTLKRQIKNIDTLIRQETCEGAGWLWRCADGQRSFNKSSTKETAKQPNKQTKKRKPVFLITHNSIFKIMSGPIFGQQ